MKKFMFWLFRQSALRIFGVILTPVAALLWLTLNKQLLQGWNFVQGAPPVVLGALMLGPLAFASFGLYSAVAYVRANEGAQVLPRYAQWWNKFPGRRVNLEIGGLFSFGLLANKYCLMGLHFTVTLRRGDPLKGAFIENLRTGQQEELFFFSAGAFCYRTRTRIHPSWRTSASA